LGSFATTGTVAVLLATFNGARYLNEQLDSLKSQSWSNIDVWVADDFSTDGSWKILEQAQRTWPKGQIFAFKGAKSGSPADNFRFLLTKVPSGYEYVAFCDQDDVWIPVKIENAIAAMGPAEMPEPMLHCSRTRLIDEMGAEIGLSTDFRKPPEFRNALVQNIAGGNTMVMNRAAFGLVKETASRTSFVSHDWWTYLIVAGAGGTILYSRQPDTLYRQHAGNSVGANLGIAAKLRRLIMLFQGRYRRWNDRNVAALTVCLDLLTPEAQTVLGCFVNARSGPPWRRLRNLRKSGVFRQTAGGNVALYLASILGLV
jgi:glycosyltransferase involved in cell wall biosynthesis